MASHTHEVIQNYPQSAPPKNDPRIGVRRLILAGILALMLLTVLWIRDAREARRVLQEANIQNVRLIPEARLEDISLRILPGSSKLGGRLTNMSENATLTGAELAISVQDCVQNSCETVGQTSVYLDGYSIPPGQSRAIDRLVRFAALPTPRGEYKWRYNVLRVWGY